MLPMKKGLAQGGSPLLVALLISAGLPLQAETYYVTVDDFGFSPATLTIQIGDTVVWENTDEEDFPHTTTSTLGLLQNGYWDGDLFSLGDTFQQIFTFADSFDYTDQGGPGTGTITVNPVVVTPVINLESPRLAGGQFLFEATGLTVGKTNVLLRSTNLTAWLPLSTNVAASASVTFTNAATGQGFYRVLELP